MTTPRVHYASVEQALANLPGKHLGTEIVVGHNCRFVIIQEAGEEHVKLLCVDRFASELGGNIPPEIVAWNDTWALKKMPGAKPGKE